MSIFPEDPRSYLRFEYDRRHKRNPSYSWRSFARDLKLSPSMLSEFLKGRYGLSKGKASLIAQSIRLDVVNTEHFIDLLEAGFHRLPAQRENARLRAEERLNKSPISVDTLRGVMDWSFLAALEIAGLEQGPARPDGWAKPFRKLQEKAVSALGKLKELNLVGEDNRPGEDMTVAGDQFSEDDLRALHEQSLNLAREALNEMSSVDRENLSVFASVAKEDFAEMRKELNDSMLQILNKYASKPGADSVFCFGLQAFPLYSKPR